MLSESWSEHVAAVGGWCAEGEGGGVHGESAGLLQYRVRSPPLVLPPSFT